MRKICVVTGTRAEYGIMSRLMQALKDTEGVKLQIIATNTHLSEKHGMTAKEIEADGFDIDYRIPLPLDDDSPRGTVKAMAVAMSGFADAYEALDPDLILILGDRYEMLTAASAAAIFGIPVAHLHGGEITEGAYDDSIRHAISKLSTYHFTSTEEYRRRVIQMGEEPARVFNAGSLGVDNILNENILGIEELDRSLRSLVPGMKFELREGFLLVTFHPVTMQPGEGERQTSALLTVLDSLKDRQVLFTMPNSDTGGNRIAEMITGWVAANKERAVCVASLGRSRFYSALAHCAAMVGNSSSGLIEAPSFGIPTVNIGDRQKGRARGNTIIDCNSDSASIGQAIAKALSPEFSDFCRQHGSNPYYQPHSLKSILSALLSLPLRRHLPKHFHGL